MLDNDSIGTLLTLYWVGKRVRLRRNKQRNQYTGTATVVAAAYVNGYALLSVQWDGSTLPTLGYSPRAFVEIT